MDDDAYGLLIKLQDQPIAAWEEALTHPGLSERAIRHIQIAIDGRKRLEAANASLNVQKLGA